MKLLLAVDLLHEPEVAVARASRWAERMNATVDLVYVDPNVPPEQFFHAPELLELMRDEWAQVRGQLKAQLDELLRLLPTAHQGTSQIAEGRPAQAVAEMAEGYDALLVNTHRYGGLYRFFLGSVAEKLVRSSPVPVLVLHPSAAERSATPDT